MVDLFGGQLQSSIECHHCHHRSTAYDPFWDLSLPLPKGSASSGSRFFSRSDASCRLDDCVSCFTEDEVMDGDEAYNCEKCKARRPATKRLRVHRFPRVLVLHVKRFNYTGFGTSRQKLSTKLEVPHTLSLAGAASDEAAPFAPSYTLCGVAHHSGTRHGGHYTADCANLGDGRWYSFNDDHVGKLDGPLDTSASAYVLFYSVD